jgi:hypothetical protein
LSTRFKEEVMRGSVMKPLFTVIMVAVATVTILPAMVTSADKDPGGAFISDFRAQSLYRAVKLRWKVKAPFKDGATFQILRSDSFADGPYSEIATVPYAQESMEYRYVDKRLPSESTYYYKLVIMGGGGTYGPISARPFFSLPST